MQGHVVATRSWLSSKKEQWERLGPESLFEFLWETLKKQLEQGT